MMHFLVFASIALAQNTPAALDDLKHRTRALDPPDGGTMLGMSRTVSGGKTVEYEFVVIRQSANGREFVARPSGQRERPF